MYTTGDTARGRPRKRYMNRLKGDIKKGVMLQMMDDKSYRDENPVRDPASVRQRRGDEIHCILRSGFKSITSKFPKSCLIDEVGTVAEIVVVRLVLNNNQLGSS